MHADIGLGSLLTALRHAGVRVGVAETARLHQVFSRVPEGDAFARLTNILQAVLAKDPENRERIGRVVGAWIECAEQDLEGARVGPSREIQISRARGSKRRLQPVWHLAALAVVVAAGLLPGPAQHYLAFTPTTPGLDSSPWREEPGRLEDLVTPARTFRSEVPVLEVVMPQLVWMGWTPLALGAVAASTALGLWLALRHRRWLPQRAPLPERKGPPRIFLSPPESPEPRLLEARQQEALVWGIGRFTAEEPSPRVDLPASVRATARAGGLPQIRYQQARHFREVWLWVDDAADDPALARLADEIADVLRTHALPVERASFHGVPRLLTTSSGQFFAPGEIDELRGTALVAVLTDGRVLTRQYAADDRRVLLDALLRGLSHWPRLVFVDFSQGSNNLSSILARHSLEALLPAELADYLGASGQRRAKSAPPITNPGDDEAWAAAAALAPAPPDEATLFDLRRALGLRASPWALQGLRRGSRPSRPPVVASSAARAAPRLARRRRAACRRCDPGKPARPRTDLLGRPV
ncbi:MAG TPA: hypothetical protein VE078_17350 [Thermoanaerobaculia bacterium]|nr:hypothetical protein [Thermoanaerobaculia bacterium]